jgi:hypothetical protein
MDNLPICKSKTQQGHLIFNYKLYHKGIIKNQPQDSKLIVSFIYNIFHIKDIESYIYKSLDVGKKLRVSRLYRFKLGISDIFNKVNIKMTFNKFSNAQKDISCCISDSMLVPDNDKFMTKCVLNNGYENIIINFKDNDLLCSEYANYIMSESIYFYIQIIHSTLIDFTGQNEDGSSLLIDIGGVIYGGYFIHHMVDIWGLTLHDYHS